jgi:hypothetical protein
VIFVKICTRKENWPDAFTRTVMILLPQMNNAVKCSDFRIIRLMCYAVKIMSRVLTKRIEVKPKPVRGKNQFGFMKNGFGIRDTIGVIKSLCERSIDHLCNVYILICRF